MPTVENIYQSVVAGNLNGTVAGVKSALKEGIGAAEILNNGLIAAMAEVGRLFEAGGEYFVPEMLIAARAMKAGTDILKPKLQEADIQRVFPDIVGQVTERV